MVMEEGEVGSSPTPGGEQPGTGTCECRRTGGRRAQAEGLPVGHGAGPAWAAQAGTEQHTR